MPSRVKPSTAARPRRDRAAFRRWCDASLVSVERVCDVTVERFRRRDLDMTGDVEREQHGAALGGTGGDESFELLRGHHVQHRGGRDQGSARQLPGSQPGDVAATCLDGDPPAVQDLPGGSAAARASRSSSRSYRTQCWGPDRRPASQRPIDSGPQPRSWIVTPPTVGRYEPISSTSCGRPGRRVGRLTQAQPLGADPHRFGDRLKLPRSGRLASHVELGVPINAPIVRPLSEVP